MILLFFKCPFEYCRTSPDYVHLRENPVNFADSSWKLLILLFRFVDFVLFDAQPLAPQLVHVLHHRVQDGEEDE
jgi:hypothetical protein